MKLVIVFLAVLAATVAANPVATNIVSEIQVAPDSLERLELVPYSWPYGFPFDFGGMSVLTSGGAAVVDSGVRFESESSCVVLDRSNTTGVFSLGDDTDCVRLCIPGSPDTVSICYPANPGCYSCWTPPAGASCALYRWWEWVPPGDLEDFHAWYIDETPTFGAPNDDTLGGLTGYVYDDHGQPIDGATVRIASSQGVVAVNTWAEWWSWPHGFFRLAPTGPGAFLVTAEKSDYLPGAYPDSILLGPNEGRQISITLYPVGVAEDAAGNPSRVGLRQRGRTLVLTADRPGTALVTVCDNLGRVRMFENVALVSGSNEVLLTGLRSGVYFVNCRFGKQTLKTKLVLY